MSLFKIQVTYAHGFAIREIWATSFGVACNMLYLMNENKNKIDGFVLLSESK